MRRGLAKFSSLQTKSVSLSTQKTSGSYRSLSLTLPRMSKIKTGLHPDETVCILRDLECKTRDGVILRGDAYLPILNTVLKKYLDENKPKLEMKDSSITSTTQLTPSSQTKSLTRNITSKPGKFFTIESPHRQLSASTSPSSPLTAYILPRNNFPGMEHWIAELFPQVSPTSLTPDSTSSHISLSSIESRKYTTVLIRTPYDKKAMTNISAGMYWAQSGFACFIQDCRGRFNSDGTFYKYTAEMKDGFDTVQWLATQPWSNSKIVGDGKSYLTHTQMTLSLANPPNWAGSFAYMGGFWNAFTSGVRQGGCYETRQLVWAYKKAPQSTPALVEYMKSVYLPAWLQGAYPWKRRENFLAHAPSFQDFVYDQTNSTTYTPFWEQIGFNTEKYVQKFSPAPALFLAGWYDIYARSTVEFFSGLSNGNGEKKLTDPVRLLVMGPWTHTGGTTSRVAGDVDFGPNAPITQLWEEHRKFGRESSQTSTDTSLLDAPVHPHYDFVRFWFDMIVPRNTTCVKDLETEFPLHQQLLGKLPSVSYFRMGMKSPSTPEKVPLNGKGQLLHGGSWQFSSSWPLAETQFQLAFLSSSTLTLIPGSSPPVPTSPAAAFLERVFQEIMKGKTATLGSRLARHLMRVSTDFGPSPAGSLPWTTKHDTKPNSSLASVFQFDPSHPCPSIGGNVFPHSSPPQSTIGQKAKENEADVEVLLAGAYDQIDRPSHMATTLGGLRLSARRDVLCFSSAPLKEDVEITGTVHALFYVASDCVDTDFTVKLVDEYPTDGDVLPSGFDLNVTHGIQRCRYRFETAENAVMEGVTKEPWRESLLQPNEPALVHVELYPTSNIFRKGHRIRIDVSSSNFPHFDVNPNTPEGSSGSQRKIVANNAVFHCPHFPSVVLLPVIPSEKGSSTQIYSKL